MPEPDSAPKKKPTPRKKHIRKSQRRLKAERLAAEAAAAPVVQEKPKQPITFWKDPWYGFTFNVTEPLDRRTVEAYGLYNEMEPEHGGAGCFEHFKNFCSLMWPWLQWNPWLEDQIRSLTDPTHVVRVGNTKLRFVPWTGCGAAGKTFASGLFAVVWWLLDPDISAVTLTSTTKDIIAQRVWPVIWKLHREAVDPASKLKITWGHMINSQKRIEASKGDARNSICAVAVEPGELQQALNKIKGRHRPRMLLVVDEANTTPPAIFECISNMAKGCQELVVLVIGNAVDQLDHHGRCCEPKNGWNSITVDDEGWETKGVPEWYILPGICRHYDGNKSPNVRRGMTIYDKIYTYENWLIAQRLGADSSQYWSQERGFWPPEGVLPTVFSKTMLLKHDVSGRHIFRSKSIPCAFLDPGFEGDKCVAVLGFIGDLDDGRMALQIDKHIVIKNRVSEKQERDHQIAHDFISFCKEHHVLPNYAGMDCTGTGRGVAAIVATEWSDQCHFVEWGSRPSDHPASTDDPRPASEVYSNKVTEMWYDTRDLVRSGQLKGLYTEAISDFCVRLFDYSGRKLILEPKIKLRARIHRSPDDGDAVAGLAEVASRHGVTPDFTALPFAPTRHFDPEEPEPLPGSDFALVPFEETATGWTENSW